MGNATKVLEELELTPHAPLQLPAVKYSKMIPSALLYEYRKICGLSGVSRAELGWRDGSQRFFSVKIDYSLKKKSIDITGYSLTGEDIKSLSKLYVKSDIDFYNPWNELFRWSWALSDLLHRIPEAKKVDVLFELDHKNRHYAGIGTVSLRAKDGTLIVEYSFRRAELSSTYPTKYLDTMEDWLDFIRKRMGSRFYEYALKPPSGE